MMLPPRLDRPALAALLLSAGCDLSAAAPKPPACFAPPSMPRPGSAASPLHRPMASMDPPAVGEADRIAAHLDRLRRTDGAPVGDGDGDDPLAAEREALYRELRMRPANSLKEELRGLRLKSTGRKPDLARRLAEHHVRRERADGDEGEVGVETVPAQHAGSDSDAEEMAPLTRFAGLLNLSTAAGTALSRAGFSSPTPVQSASIPPLARGESALLHAETGSGKTLAYLLPITELMWKEREVGADDPEEGAGFGVVLTPTRELAAQVAGVATVLAPPGSVRLVGKPTDLMGDPSRDRGDVGMGGRRTDGSDRGRSVVPRLVVGSAKSIATSLFGNEKMPAPPTSKPQAKFFLRNVRWLVLDEVDRLLNVKKSRTEKRFKRHEKPAAVLASSVARQTLGRAQIVAASATVGRPLRRELARVLGLSPAECPPVVRAAGGDGDGGDRTGGTAIGGGHSGRAVTVPREVRNYVLPCMGSTSGSLLTSAAFAFKSLPPITSAERGRRTLLVLSKDCGLSVRNTLGALKHFGCQPEPKSLLDALESDGGTDRLIEAHRAVSGAAGIGESARGAPGTRSSSSSRKGDDGDDDDNGGYLLVTGEDSIRGLHLDGLDTVLVVGRPHGPDEYAHIAGRTGRAGRQGDVINVVSYEQAAALTSWERMLDVDFIPLDAEELSGLE